MKKFLSILLCVCLLATTVFVMPMASAEEATEYFYHTNDYESLVGDEAWLSCIEQGRTMSVENGANVISGNQSLKITSDGGEWVGAALSNVAVPADVNARVSFDYKVTVGTKGWGGIGYIGYHSSTNSAGVENVNCYNWSNINSNNFTEKNKEFTAVNAVSTVKSVNATIARKGTGSYPVGIFWNDGKAPSEVIFDNLIIAEIINTVSAVSDNEEKGTVTVANKNSTYTDYAMYETAVFTATPNEGYSFKGWYNAEDVLVSDKATYEHTLTGDTTLTAKWKLYEKEYQYFEMDYENLTDYDTWFSSISSLGTMSLETENPINGSASLKLSIGKTGSGDYAAAALLPISTSIIPGQKYRISASTKALKGTFTFGRIGTTYTDNSKLNWSAMGTSSPYATDGKPVDLFTAWQAFSASSGKISVTGTLTAASGSRYTKLVAVYHANALDSTDNIASLLIDDVVAAQIIGTVAAVPEDDSMGSATVANKNAKLTDFAVNETAVFTATPANGYYFVGWYDAEGNLVSTDDTYETVVTTDTTLTAKFDDVENLIQVSFDSNGGTDVETVSGGAGAKINMPANPTKDGYTFAGWYTDKDCTEKYLCKVFPEADTTLYAKWINGIYQNFENFTANAVNVEILNDIDYSYDGTHTVKATANNKATFRVIVANTGEKLSAFANLGDTVTISFKYKLVSGSVSFYPHTATQRSNAWTTTAESGFGFYATNFTETSDEWKTFTHTYTLNSLSGEYTLLFFTATSDNTEIYVDDVMVYKTIDIPINYSTEAVRLEPTNAAKPLTAAIQGDTVEFRAVCDSTVTPTVKYGENVLTPTNGVYAITVTADDELTVTAEGITDAQNHAPGVGLGGEDLTKYDADVFGKPVWEGDTVYHEAVMFVNSIDGTVQTTKKLLYPIDDIISIRNQYLNKWYVKGVDFKVEDGKLVWIEGGNGPIYTGPLAVPADENDEFYDNALNYGGYNSASAYYTLTNDPTKGLKLMSDGDHEKYTVYVTYKHSTTWDAVGEDGYTPAAPDNQSYDMKNFYNKLATTDDVNVLVYGASTATGCASTGANVNYELFSKSRNAEGLYTVTERNEKGSGISAPTFFEQATAELVNKYGNGNKINYYNIACGGTGASWGAENLKDRVAGMNEYYGNTIVPDIIYIKFAGNDVRTTPESYKNSFTSMINDFKELYPNATIVLVSGKINNEKTYIYGNYRKNMMDLEQVLTDLADATPNCIVAKTTSVWAEIVESKDYEDYLSNNINHANDFWAKTTASIIVAAAEKNENVSAIKTAYNSAAALRTAESSSSGKNGLRIYNEIKTEWIKSAEIVEYGAVAISNTKLADAELTVDNGVKGIAYSDGTHSAAKPATLWENNNGAYVFTAYLTNISNYGTTYSIRSYAIDKNGKVYYGDTVEVEVFKVANAIDNANTADGSEQTEADAAAFYTFVNEENYTEYKAWCDANSLSVGALYAEKYGA